MSDRAVYDTMIFFQWAVLPAEQQRRTIEALYDGSVRLCLSAELVREIRDVLTRPELVARFPALSIDRVDQVLREAAKHADFFPAVLAPHLQIVSPPDFARAVRS